MLHGASCAAQNERPHIPRTRYCFSIYGPGRLAIPNATPWDTVNIKKEIYRIFNHNGLRITIEANKQTINFLDAISTWTKVPTSPSQSLIPHYITSTAKATTHQSPQRTYPPASINDCHPFIQQSILRPSRPSISKSTLRKWIPVHCTLRTTYN